MDARKDWRHNYTPAERFGRVAAEINTAINGVGAKMHSQTRPYVAISAPVHRTAERDTVFTLDALLEIAVPDGVPDFVDECDLSRMVRRSAVQGIHVIIARLNAVCGQLAGGDLV